MRYRISSLHVFCYFFMPFAVFLTLYAYTNVFDASSQTDITSRRNLSAGRYVHVRCFWFAYYDSLLTSYACCYFSCVLVAFACLQCQWLSFMVAFNNCMQYVTIFYYTAPQYVFAYHLMACYFILCHLTYSFLHQ